MYILQMRIISHLRLDVLSYTSSPECKETLLVKQQNVIWGLKLRLLMLGLFLLLLLLPLLLKLTERYSTSQAISVKTTEDVLLLIQLDISILCTI